MTKRTPRNNEAEETLTPDLFDLVDGIDEGFVEEKEASTKNGHVVCKGLLGKDSKLEIDIEMGKVTEEKDEGFSSLGASLTDVEATPAKNSDVFVEADDIGSLPPEIGA
ncbi:hypothetical protein LOTGIDRAFT_161495 [Lottia gigantea]|uniref:Uncharacterized protein n=1 Tax=Lottia gigantea TaxID=225164 RepID=V4AL01_LOTGI|nr:hypothetical protein LOTGIDRAFT_161495 [Lottia gigantea]ESO94276.1 hypothetical protein LOTGIDRAFT_161495 [Lottia gigantea]